MKRILLDATYDKEADAAYVYTYEKKKRGTIYRTKALPDKNIILDFDKSDKLIGVEIIGKHVHKSLKRAGAFASADPALDWAKKAISERDKIIKKQQAEITRLQKTH